MLVELLGYKELLCCSVKKKKLKMDITTNGHNEDLQNFKITLKAESWPEVCNIYEK